MTSTLIASLAICAAASGAADEPHRVLIWEVQAIGLSEQMQHLVGASVANAASRVPGVEHIATSDLTDMLDVQYQKRLAGCDDAECTADIANAMGVRYILTIEAVELEQEIAITLKLFDNEETRVLGRATERIEPRADEIVRAVDRALDRVYYSHVTSLGPVTVSTLAAGGVLAVGATILGVMARSRAQQYRESVRPQPDLDEEARLLGGSAIAAGILSVAAVGTGVLLLMRPERSGLVLAGEPQ